MKWNFRLLSKMGQSNYKFWMGIVTVAECVCLQRCQQTFEKFFQCMENLAGREAHQISARMKKVKKSYPPKKGKVSFQGQGPLRILWCLPKFRCHLYVTDRRAGLSHHGSRTKKREGETKRGGDETQFRSRATLTLLLLVQVGDWIHGTQCFKQNY